MTQECSMDTKIHEILHHCFPQTSKFMLAFQLTSALGCSTSMKSHT